MSLRKSIIVQFAILLGLVIYSVVIASRMPDVVPVHWGINGKPDRYGSKWESVVIMPLVLVFNIGFTLLLPKISPKKFKIESFESTYGYVMVLVSLMMAALHVIIMRGSSGSEMEIKRLTMPVMFIFFALLGNVIGKVKQNYYMGVRTPWTLSSEKVWHATHRAAGRLWFVGGIVGALLGLVGVPMVALILLLFVIALTPVVHSYVLYRKLEPDEMNGAPQ